MSVFTLFRDGRIYRDPVRFWPERWIEGTLPEKEQALARTMFAPFSIGPRNCAGAHVPILIASIAYVYILVNYDFRLGRNEQRTAPHVWSNTPDEIGADKELVFESHYSIAGWLNGPPIELKARPSAAEVDH
jgi:cytochrome P450